MLGAWRKLGSRVRIRSFARTRRRLSAVTSVAIADDNGITDAAAFGSTMRFIRRFVE
jgi:hypothetical protein